MQFRENFDVFTFDWTWPAAKKVIEMVRKAGKFSEFQKALEDWFGVQGAYPTADEIQEYVAEYRASILKRIGLDEHGNRLDVKKFKVFYRITGVSSDEFEAESPEEARKKFMDDFFDSPGDPLHCILRDDIETVVPVCYEGEDGETRDYEYSEEHRNELRNALVGAELWILTRIPVDECDEIGDPEVSVYESFERAKEEMAKDFEAEQLAYENEGGISHFLDPKEGEHRCYIVGNDKSEEHWHITKA